MALTNDQITAQNFKDFYGQIRPYLNGNVPTFANTFNKSDLYSTDEQLVGRWIDGKPIYQKSIIASDPVVGNNTIPHNITNLDRVIKCDGTVMRNGDNFTFSLPICYISNVAQWSIATSGINKSTVNITVGNGFTGTYALSDLVVTLQYTKTTDSSMSISDGNEYSLNEQIIGHWIDGKPVYQKTIIWQGNLPAGQTQIDPQISNIDVMIELKGTVFREQYFTNICEAESSTQMVNTYYHTGSHKICIDINKLAYNNATVRLTLQYTKTTD